LRFEGGEFDCVVANAMLYHVSDLDLALSELVRVLEPGGRLIAMTFGQGHMAELWSLVGFEIPQRPFSAENGEEHLRRHFARVERNDLEATLVFPDAVSVRRYVDSTCFSDLVRRPLPDFEGPFRSKTTATVFVAVT
jgi:SAM-dependent methyltransferase